jgi:hypothetical protein
MADLVFRLAIDGLQLLVLLSVPGAAIVVSLTRGPVTLLRFGVLALSTSLLYQIVISAALLHFGLFSIGNLLLGAVLSLIPVVVRWRQAKVWLRQIETSVATLLPAVCAALGVALLLTLTPIWNFLVAPGMDAGNYEAYGNLFWTTGSFYLDGRELLDQGAEPEWLGFYNTWNLDEESGLARPSYLPGYPVLLGVFKANFESAVASPAVNVALAGLSTALMILIGLQVYHSSPIAAGLSLALFATPMLFFYGKQFMSEQLGLLAILLVVHGVLAYRGRTIGESQRADEAAAGLALTVGVGLGLLARLDFYLLVPLLVIGFLLVEVDKWTTQSEPSAYRRLYLGPGLAVALASATSALLGHPAYLNHGRPGFLEEVVTPNAFIGIFGLANGLAMVLVGFVGVLLDRFAKPTRRVAMRRLLSAGYVALAGVWALFMIWNLLIRPQGPDLTEAAHDSENLLRLFSVTSPVVLAVTLVASPIVLVVERKYRGLLAALMVGLGTVVFASRHSAPDLWWMRRYIQFIIPVMLLVVLGAISQIQKRDRRHSQRGVLLIGVALFFLALTQVWFMQPMLRAEINPDVPTRLAQFTRSMEEEPFVVIVEGSSMVRGLATTYRSLNEEDVLVDVPLDELERAASLRSPYQRLVVVTSSPLASETLEDLGLEAEPEEGTIERQWANWREELYGDPDPSQEFRYFVYEAESG